MLMAAQTFFSTATSNAAPASALARRGHRLHESSDRDPNETLQSNVLKLPGVGKNRRGHHAQYSTPPQRLRSQHLDVLISILHRSLLNGDQPRLRRAWASFIRAGLTSTLDLRPNARWSLGAEVLLQPEPATAATASLGSSSRDEGSDLMNGSSAIKRFDKARRYYERLILQFPFRRAFPHYVSALDFHPAYFSLWIHTIQRQIHAREEVLSGSTLGSEALEGDSSDTLDDEMLEGHGNSPAPLAEARLLLEKLESVMSSPPYSDEQSLWRMRAMLYLWMADLVISEPHFDIPNSPPSKSLHGSETKVLMSASTRAAVQQKVFDELQDEDWEDIRNFVDLNPETEDYDSSAQRARLLLSAHEAFNRASQQQR